MTDNRRLWTEAKDRLVRAVVSLGFREELAELSRQVDEKAKAQAETLAAQLENQKAALRAKAGGKLDQAAALVVERIVNS